MLKQFKVILWDFDGVIMDSMPIRSKGFEVVLQNYPKEEIDRLLEYHNKNGGLSRYVKFRYFFEVIRNEEITDWQIKELAEKFSEVMLELLINEELLIQDSVKFIRENFDKYAFHIVSGSDGVELNHICKELNLSNYFLTINGSPTPKKQLVSDLLEEFNYLKHNVCLIGDSINDFEASEYNGISFFGYNNERVRLLSTKYIDTFLLYY